MSNPTHEVIEKLEKLKAWMVSLLAGEPPIPTLEVKLALKRVEAALALLQPVATPVGPSTLVEEGVRTMTAHELKIWPVYFQAVIEGRKTFEVRRNDRDFKVGDTLRLREFNPENGGSYTGREVCRAIAYLSEFAQELGYVVLALSTAPAGEARLRELAGEFVDYWTGENEARVRRIGAEAASGCGMCGGIPHSTTCFVGRFQALLTAADALDAAP